MAKIKSYRQSGRQYVVSNEALVVSDIKALTGEQIDKLDCGDIVIKEDASGKHAYLVTYKKDKVGICISYFDASTVETESYDYTDGAWVYNSQDKATL